MDDVKLYCTTWDEQAIYDLKTVVSSEDFDAALSREAALREELESHPDVSMKNCIFEGKNADGSQAFEYETLDGVLKKLTKINLDGWVCYGPLGENPFDALQQRLTVAEQLLMDALSALDMIADNTDDCDAAEICRERVRLIGAALKPAAEGEGS